MTQVIDSVSCSPGQHFEFSYNLSGTMPYLSCIPETLPSDDIWKLEVLFSNGEEVVYGYNSTFYNSLPLYHEEDPGWYRMMDHTGKIDFFICDENNFARYLQGDSLRCNELHQDTTNLDITFYLPTEANYYLVFSNDEHLNVSEFLPIAVYLYHNVSAGIDGGPIEAGSFTSTKRMTFLR